MLLLNAHAVKTKMLEFSLYESLAQYKDSTKYRNIDIEC